MRVLPLTCNWDSSTCYSSKCSECPSTFSGVCSQSVHSVLSKCAHYALKVSKVCVLKVYSVHCVFSKCAHCALKVCTVCSGSVHIVFSKCVQCTVCSQEVFEGSPTSHGIQRAHTRSTNSLQSAISQSTKSDLHFTREPKSSSSPDIALILWLSCDLQTDVRIVMRIFTGILSAKTAVLISECLLYLLQQLKSVKAAGRETNQGHKARRSRLAKSWFVSFSSANSFKNLLPHLKQTDGWTESKSVF